MQWSPQQNQALKSVDKWFFQESKKKQVFYLAGYAGTGKTTLARHFAENIDGDVLYAAFTGKAALMMQKNGCIGARTIHSLIYKVEVNKTTGEVTFHLNKNGSQLCDAALLIVDECSMVDEKMGKDLLSFGKPILVLGDPAQLPPVAGSGFFTERKPDMMLTEIHRQAEESPIIYLATQIRQGTYPDIGEYGESKIVSKISSTDALEAEQLLAGRNITRQDYNRRIRKLLKYEPDNLVVGDKLICLRNDSDAGIYNGGMFQLDQILQQKYKTNFYHLMLSHEGEPDSFVKVKVHKSFFNDDVKVPDWKTLKGSQEFDWGYCITTHKSQGSQWSNVLINDESWCFRDVWQRWLYTAVTRASEKVTILKG